MVQATTSIFHVAVLIKDCVLSIMVQIKEHVPVSVVRILKLVNKFQHMTVMHVHAQHQFNHTMQILSTVQLLSHFVMQKVHVVRLVKLSQTLT